MISSTAAPVTNVLGEPSTRKGYIMTWFSSSIALNLMVLQGARHTGCSKTSTVPENLSVETTGNECPAVRSDPRRHAAKKYDVTGRDAQIAGKYRFANPTTTWLEARSVLRNQTLKIKPIDAWDLSICKHNVTERS